MAFPSISDIGDAPTKQDPSTFDDRADAVMTALENWGGASGQLALWAAEAESVASGISSDKDDAETAQTAAETAQTAAEAAAEGAEAAANATIWIVGETYTAGAVVMDPDNGYMLYTSQAAANTGNQPYSDDGTWWRPTGQGILDWELDTELTVTFDDPTADDITETWMDGATEVATRVTEFGTAAGGEEQITETFTRNGVTTETVTVFETDGSITITKEEVA
jgi:hypothetical protein